ncbi:MAG: ATP-binding protein [Halobacteriaceae archaeon]
MAADSDGIELLLVEDNPGDARLIRHHLRSGGGVFDAAPDLVHVESREAAVERLAGAAFDLVLLDLGLADTSGIETLERFQADVEAAPDIDPVPVVVLTGLSDEQAALQAIRAGAQDYLLKDDLGQRLLVRSVRYALERHRQERELERQNERLERFASVVSHDLRNPLSVAKGRLDIARAEHDDENLAAVAGALDRMETLVEDLLALAREGQTVDEVETVDIAAVAERAWRNVGTGDGDLRVEAAGTLSADGDRLVQVFENLFRNAVEHGGADVTVEVGALDGGEGFYVADDGPGIPAGDRDGVFESGYTTRENGTGFGLAIVREIAEAHGWTIGATEGRAGGARFEVTGPSLESPGADAA